MRWFKRLLGRGVSAEKAMEAREELAAAWLFATTIHLVAEVLSLGHALGTGPVTFRLAIGVAAASCAVYLPTRVSWAQGGALLVLSMEFLFRLRLFSSNHHAINAIYMAGDGLCIWFLYSHRELYTEDDSEDEDDDEYDEDEDGDDEQEAAAGSVAEHPGPVAPAAPMAYVPVAAETRAAAIHAIHQHVAFVGGASRARPEDVRRLAQEHGVSLAQLHAESLGLYRSFLDHYAGDGILSVEEQTEMYALQGLLQLTNDDVRRLTG